MSTFDCKGGRVYQDGKTPRDSGMSGNSTTGIRIDRWLWYARFSKSRSQAAEAVQGGHVRINGQRAKPGSRVIPGDRLRILRDSLEYNVVIQSVPARRGPAAEARTCYLEDEASRECREAAIERIRQDRRLMPRVDGRLDKRTRRKIRQFNRESTDD
jgi:ribosome-associated heat shock protein Hsp15